MENIDLSKPVIFYDDRNKHDVDFRMTEVLYQSDDLCLCVAVPVVRPKSRLAEDIKKVEADTEDAPEYQWWMRVKKVKVLFDLKTGEVQSKDFDSWIATNDITVFNEYEDITKEPELNAVN